jgi:hypothetical protein
MTTLDNWLSGICTHNFPVGNILEVELSAKSSVGIEPTESPIGKGYCPALTYVPDTVSGTNRVISYLVSIAQVYQMHFQTFVLLL